MISNKPKVFEVRTVILYDCFRFPMEIPEVVYGVTIYNDINR